MLVWCYDEHGGYYDHVPPPAAPEPDDKAPEAPGPYRYDRLGFRVPAVIVSPFARPEYVSHVTHDHTSVLKLIERKWNLPPLTRRDAAADDLLDSLDLAAPPAFATPPTLAPPKRPGLGT
jgi:phospholipase C